MFCFDILDEIFSFLDLNDLTLVSLSCKEFHSIVSQTIPFKELELFKIEFPNCIKDSGKVNYYDMLKKHKLVLFKYTYEKTEKDNVFQYACRNGDLQICQWLYSRYNVDIHEDNEYAFQLACRNGDSKICQWLYSLGNVNIHALNECAFRCSCGCGHLHICKWLYSLGDVDIHADDQDALFWANFNDHFHVAMWLKSL